MGLGYTVFQIEYVCAVNSVESIKKKYIYIMKQMKKIHDIVFGSH